MLNRKMKPIAVAVGAAFAASVATSAMADSADPFEAEVLKDGVLLADAHGDAEGEGEAKCGEGKCGEGEEGEGEGKCGEGNCGEGEEGEGEGGEEEGE